MLCRGSEEESRTSCFFLLFLSFIFSLFLVLLVSPHPTSAYVSVFRLLLVRIFLSPHFLFFSLFIFFSFFIQTRLFIFVLLFLSSSSSSSSSSYFAVLHHGSSASTLVVGLTHNDSVSHVLMVVLHSHISNSEVSRPPFAGQPCVLSVSCEDWTMMSLRFEMHLLAHSFKRDVNDMDRRRQTSRDFGAVGRPACRRAAADHAMGPLQPQRLWWGRRNLCPWRRRGRPTSCGCAGARWGAAGVAEAHPRAAAACHRFGAGHGVARARCGRQSTMWSPGPTGAPMATGSTAMGPTTTCPRFSGEVAPSTRWD